MDNQQKRSALMKRAMNGKFETLKPAKRGRRVKLTAVNSPQPPSVAAGSILEGNHSEPRCASPAMTITSEDIRVFEEEVKRSYGVTDSATVTDQKHQSDEQRRLLCEVRIPLNNSASKWVSIGLDPFLNFEPVVKIYKSGVETGIMFPGFSYDQMVDKLGGVLETVKKGEFTTGRIGFCDVTLVPDTEILKFKCDGDFVKQEFELYVTRQTLETLDALGEFIMSVLKELAGKNYNVTFVNMCAYVFDIARSDHCCEDSDFLIKHVLHEYYKDDLVMHELYFKFTNFVVSAVEREIIRYHQY